MRRNVQLKFRFQIVNVVPKISQISLIGIYLPTHVLLRKSVKLKTEGHFLRLIHLTLTYLKGTTYLYLLVGWYDLTLPTIK